MPHDYTTVTAADVERVVTDAIEEGEAILASLLAVEGERTFENTLQPFDAVAALVTDAFGRGPFMSHVHPDQAVRDAATAAAERLERWQVELDSRVDLSQALSAYADSDAARALEGEWARVLEHKLRDFRRAGTDLQPHEREEVERLRGRLVEVSVAFQRNVDEYEDALELTREELDGLPDSYVARLQPGEEPDTHRVSLDYPERFPFLDQARRRDLRKELYLKSWRIAVEENRPLLREALQIRDRLADLLGQPDWAHYAMEVRMADPPAVEEFYTDLVPALGEKADAELAVMAAMLAEDDGDDVVRPWDTRYCDTQIRRRDFGVDPNEVAEHFALEQVIEGMFDLTADVFGLRYERAVDAEAWHEEVFLYDIRDADSGEHLAWFYADLFPRKGKFAHAAAWDLVAGHRRADGSYERPVAAIVANFPRPSGDSPSLLLHADVVTLFHEFGHILHQCLTTAESARFAGTSTERDFVEAPSQIMENWCWDADVLRRFARHHGTGEPILEELVAQLVAARDLDEGLSQLRQCYFGKLDLAFHSGNGERDLDALTRDIFAVTRLPYPEEDTFFPASFGHLLGGYDAGYYGYLWALVYGHDMFSRFEEEGVTNPEVGRAYRRAILEPGGSEPAIDLVRRFLGREPSNEAFLRRLGIAASS
ncbi:MAG: M3 family metallopeptidase [Nitriliruptorales bacterium]